MTALEKKVTKPLKGNCPGASGTYLRFANADNTVVYVASKTLMLALGLSASTYTRRLTEGGWSIAFIPEAEATGHMKRTRPALEFSRFDYYDSDGSRYLCEYDVIEQGVTMCDEVHKVVGGALIPLSSVKAELMERHADGWKQVVRKATFYLKLVKKT